MAPRSQSKGRKRSATPSRRQRSATPARNAQPKKEVVATTPTKVQEVDTARRFTPERDQWDGHYEFGGVLGALGLMVFSHFIMYYFWLCIEHYNGTLMLPYWSPRWEEFVEKAPTQLWEGACPTLETFGIFSAFLFVQYVLAVIMPGPVTHGLPIPSENQYRFTYKCNAVFAWYALLCIVGGLHYYDIFPLWKLREQFGHYMTASVIWANVISVICYIEGLPRAIRMSGNPIYDFFMGSALNYRLPFDVDLKLFAEIRNSWMLLFMLTCSCAAKMYHDTGAINGNMAFMIVAHLLYVNACQKGEECIPTTWDIYYEKFGWMLIFWNFSGVPFVYCFQSLYIQTVTPTPQYSVPALTAMFTILLCAYYIWDNVNSQKNRFRMKRQGVSEDIIRRKTFPQLPWGYIENPRTIKSDKGELFVDGWYRYGRKIHYAVDLTMAFLWGLSCGTDAFIPFFYFMFFFGHLMHREARDEERCRAKYGPLWEEYVKIVPYKFIPYVY